MLLFLHMPKCAGTSIKELLELHCSYKLIFDYQSFFKIPTPERSNVILNSLNYPLNIDKNHLVFGHFFPVKYIGDKCLTDLKLVTIIRDPISRLISHYYFWNNGDFSDHYLWRKMIENRWTLEQFIMSDEMRNFYDQYFSQCPLQFFSYIGIYENLIESTQKCFQVLGVNVDSIDIPHSNKTKYKIPREISPSFIEEAIEFHAQDYLIYNYAMKKFHPHFNPVSPPT